MISYSIEFSRTARKQLGKLPRGTGQRIADGIETLADNPLPPGVKKLTDKDDLYRIRIGDYRVIYQINESMLLILIVKIGHRGDIYRK